MISAMNQSLLVESEEEDSTKLICNAFYDGNPTLIKGSGEFLFDDLDFEDMLGNKIDGWACNVIYADDKDGLV
ncbi:class V chitinase [Penicillium waksmanii]|uniref:class V chitinase n=1 Tax=Penicillium waksmanii TaxID=69791 RepID=UPI002547FF0F|nr:class V chitinase [Penicillium waksmanii]KAJ5984556.1 class V chitinase [Penicillium waksmanii]